MSIQEINRVMNHSERHVTFVAEQPSDRFGDMTVIDMIPALTQRRPSADGANPALSFKDRVVLCGIDAVQASYAIRSIGLGINFLPSSTASRACQPLKFLPTRLTSGYTIGPPDPTVELGDRGSHLAPTANSYGRSRKKCSGNSSIRLGIKPTGFVWLTCPPPYSAEQQLRVVPGRTISLLSDAIPFMSPVGIDSPLLFINLGSTHPASRLPALSIVAGSPQGKRIKGFICLASGAKFHDEIIPDADSVRLVA